MGLFCVLGAGMIHDTIIIGGGASGLFCAARLGGMGKQVLVLEHAKKPGRKILMSGGGKCNFINEEIDATDYLSANRHFVKSALGRFGFMEFMAYIWAHEVTYEVRGKGQYFCQDSARPILDMLLTECAQGGARIQTSTTVDTISKNQNVFILKTKNSTLYARHLVIATGGLSIPSMGASGFGYQIARQFGHNCIRTRAGLAPMVLTCKVGQAFKTLSGISTSISITTKNGCIFFGSCLITHRGLSGPVVLDASNYFEIGDAVTINWAPDVDLGNALLSQKRRCPKRAVLSALMCAMPHAPTRLVKTLASLVCDAPDAPLSMQKDEGLIRIAKRLMHFTLKPADTEGYRVAEVTLGGVDTADICQKTMMSHKVDGLYFIGEVLDVAGRLGGYNFAWAWASANACAYAIAQR